MSYRTLSVLLSVLLAAVIWQGCDEEEDDCPSCELCAGGSAGQAGGGGSGAAGGGGSGGAPAEIAFEEAEIKIEINATDEDSGLHVFLDAKGWEIVRIFDPSGSLIFTVEGSGGVRSTGLTELFFESAEPGYTVLPLAEFLARFPAGEYRFEGMTTTGERLVSQATLSHALPAAPTGLQPAAGSVQDPAATVIGWQLVPDPPGSQIVGYEVIVEQEVPVLRVLSARLPPSATSLTVPPEFLQPDTDYKYEVIAIEQSGNQTLVEVPFRTSP